MSPSWSDLPAHLPPGFVPAWLVVFGLIVGSFLNVVVHRLPRGESLVRPRSACPSCRRTIRWHENVPVLSWLVLRGRCAGCGARISARYLLVEVLAGILALVAWLVFGWSAALPVALAFAWALLALVFTDLEHMILPDAITLPGTFVALALSFTGAALTGPEEALLGVLVAIFVVEGLNLSYRILRGRDGFGAGDTKMLMLVGAVLGWKLALFTLVAGSVVGAVVAVPLLAWSRRGAARAEEPSSPEEAAPPEEAASPEEAAGRHDEQRPTSTLAELCPRTPEELLAPLTYLALAASFTPALPAAPSRALAGLLAGIVLMKALQAAKDRLRGAPPRALARRSELLPLVGALAGWPATPRSGLLAGIVLLLWAAAHPLLRRVLPGVGAGEPEEAGPGDGEPAPVMQSEIPFGVFLGLGALLSLFAGEDVIGWYVGLFPVPGLEP
jgi:leader peptidase (prepilin peptidase)/N-methyltransferase